MTPEPIKTQRSRGRLLQRVIANSNYQNGIELGTHLGGFAWHILAKGNVRHLTCVDPWIGRFYPKQDPEDRYKLCLEKLSEFGDRVTIIRKKSLEAVDQFEDASFDFVYIDALHRYAYPDGSGCNADIHAYWPKVKPGGFFGGHDYYARHQCGVIQAVTEFRARTGQEVQLTGGAHPTWWTIRHKNDH